MAKFWKTLSTIEEIIMVIGMVVMVFFNAFNVFCRYLLPQSPFSYTEELVVLVFVWVSMIGISYCYRRRSHTVLNVLTDALPDAVQPAIIVFSGVCSMLLMALMVYTGYNAMMNQIRASFGLEPIAWLKGESTSMFAMVLLCMWRWTGMNILYYMAGLKSIPNDLYEAAEIDGANEWQKFWNVILPLLKPTAIYVLTISIYAGLSMFTESYMIFGNNNSPKNYGLTIVGYLYRYGFEKVDKFGFASAVGLVLLVGAMIITVAQLIVTGTIQIGKKEEK